MSADHEEMKDMRKGSKNTDMPSKESGNKKTGPMFYNVDMTGMKVGKEDVGSTRVMKAKMKIHRVSHEKDESGEQKTKCDMEMTHGKMMD